MSAPRTASMPQFTQLGYNTMIVLEAIDPSTGDPVSGVVVTKVEVWGDVSEPDNSTPTPLEPLNPILVGEPGE